MSEFLPGVGPVTMRQAEVNLPPVTEAIIPAKPIPPLTPEQIQAVDAVLARDQESENVAALMALWSGGMLLKDLAEEHFHLPDREEQDTKRPEQNPPE
jgi:hypothetical protein